MARRWRGSTRPTRTFSVRFREGSHCARDALFLADPGLLFPTRSRPSANAVAPRRRGPKARGDRREAAASAGTTCWAAPSQLGKYFFMISIESNRQRCGHPGQQHGLRMPPRSLSMPTSMRRLLVSSFLGDMTQQIHSFRASGVISIQSLFALALDSMAFRKSAGSLCTVPPSH
jgi:hypothetical protein